MILPFSEEINMKNYKNKNISIDFELRKITVFGQEKKLDAKAFKTLEYLHKNKHKVIECCDLIDEVWDGRPVNNDVLVAAIGRIRKNIDTNSKKSVIRTVHRVGYQFIDNEQEKVSFGDKKPVLQSDILLKSVSVQLIRLRKWISLCFTLLFLIVMYVATLKSAESNSYSKVNNDKSLLILPVMYGEKDEISTLSYTIRNDVIKSLKSLNQLDIILSESTKELASKENNYQYHLSSNVYNNIFENNQIDYIVSLRLTGKPDGTSVSVKLINPNDQHCRHHFFVHKSLDLVEKISKDVDLYIHEGCNWRPIPNEFNQPKEKTSQSLTAV